MGIYLPNMEMPTNCAECKMYVDDIYCCHLLQRQIENPWADDGVETDCPLVPVPPHGRLIDADAMFKDICDDINAMTAVGIAVDGQWLWDKLNDALEDAPTIIPAEEG